MTDFTALTKKTEAYKIISAEKRAGKLSHAYLILCPDKYNLKNYLKVFAKLIACEDDEPCDNCRVCRGIDEESFSDVYFYPTENKISTDDVVSLIGESYIKPIESDKKIFVLVGADEMLAPAQNKLLKTLEEPPSNVYIILGATTEYPLLQTVKSRVRKLKIDGFSDDDLIGALRAEYSDEQKLLEAVSLGDGTVGTAVNFYNDENFEKLFAFTEQVILDMQSSKQVLKFVQKIQTQGISVLDMLSVLELKFRDMLLASVGAENLIKNKNGYARVKGAKGYTTGALVYALEKIASARERKKFNGNDTMVAEWLFFQILEGKYKWQK